MLNILWLAVCYMIGAVPFGLLVAKTTCNVDPREAGSRNIGTTNVARLCGTRLGILVLALDVLKGTIPVWIATGLSESWFFLGLCALACVLGHMYSCWLGMSGGKGFATMIGAALPVFLFVSGNFGVALFAAIATFLLYWKHRENIDRLAEGRENPWRKKS